MSNSESDLFFWLIAGLAFGVFLFWKGFYLRKRVSLIENIPSSKIRSAALGLVEVVGKIAPMDGLFQSPFAGVPCVYYSYKVQERRGSGKNSRWVTVKKDQTSREFFIEDETGKLAIDPRDAEVHFEVDHNYSTGIWASQNQTAFKAGLERLGVKCSSFLGISASMRCDEVYLKPGDTLYVLGEAVKNELAEPSSVGHETLKIAKGEAPVYCLSDKSEKAFLSGMKWKMIACFYGGPVLATACLFFLVESYF